MNVQQKRLAGWLLGPEYQQEHDSSHGRRGGQCVASVAPVALALAHISVVLLQDGLVAVPLVLFKAAGANDALVSSN